MIKKILTTIGVLTILLYASPVFALPATRSEQNIAPFLDNTYDLGSSSPSLYWRNIFLKGNLTNPNISDGCASWSSGILTSLGVSCGSGGGGSGGGPFSTTTSSVSGRLNIYANNNTDILNIGGTGTTTSKFFFDPNTSTYRLSGTGTSTGPFTAFSTITAPNFFATSTSNSTGTSTFAGSLQIGSGLFNTQFTPQGFFGTVGNPQVQIANNTDDVTSLITMGNAATGNFTAGCLTLVNGNTPATGGISATYNANFCLAGPNFNAYPGLPPNGALLSNSDGGLVLAAISTNTSSSSINFAVGPGFSNANYDITMSNLNSTTYPNSYGTANLGLGSSTPIARLSITASSTNNIPYILIASTTNGTNSTNGTVSPQTVFTLDNKGRLGLGTTTPADILAVQGDMFIAGKIVSTSTKATIIPYASTTMVTAANASTTILTVSNTSSALLLTSSAGLVSGYAGVTCTNQFLRALSSVGGSTCATVGAADVSLANLTATDASLTFSGTYNGSIARTIGLNLGNANTWTALQSFTNANSILATGSTTLQAFTGTNATTTNATSTTLSASSSFCLANDCRNSWPSSSAVGGSDTQVQFNDGGSALGGSAGFTYNKTATRATVTYASTTAITGTTVCIGTDCKTAWPSSGGGTYPFTPATTYNTISSGTSTPLWLQGSPYSLFASSTSVFTNASTTLLTTSFQDVKFASTSLSLASATSSEYYIGGAFVKVLGRYAYMTADSITASSSLTIIDVSNPATPKVVGRLRGTDSACIDGAEGFEIRGKYLYISSLNTSSFGVVDISNPTLPKVISCITDTKQLNTLEDVVFYGKYVLGVTLSNPSQTLIPVIDVSDPLNPFIATSTIVYNTNNSEWIQVEGKYAYLTSTHTGYITALDLSDPLHLVTAGQVDMGGGQGSFGFAKKGRYAYVGTFKATDNLSPYGINVIDIGNPTSMRVLASTTIGYKPWTMRISGDSLFISSVVDNSIHVYDVSSSTNPTQVSSLKDDTNLLGADDIWINAPYIYVAANGDSSTIGEFSIVRMPSITTPALFAGNIKSDNLENSDSIYTNNLFVNTQLNIGTGGFMSNGTSTVSSLLQGLYFISTTTKFANVFPYASTTAISAGTLCLDTCKTAWPSSGGGTYPFVPATTYNTISSGTSTPLWLQGSPFSLFASSTAVFSNASTTAFTITGTKSAMLKTDATGLVGQWGGIGCDPVQLVQSISSSGAGTCVSINNGYWSGTALSIGNGGTNATSFTTSGNGVYYNGTSLLTAPLTSAVTTPYASSTMSSTIQASSTNETVGVSLGVGTTSPSTILSVKGGAIFSAESALATSTAISVDMATTSNQILIQLGTSATTITLTHILPGMGTRLVTCNPGSTAGAVTFATNPANLLLWTGGTVPAQTTTAKKCDVWTFTSTQGTSTTAVSPIVLGAQIPNF